MANTGRQSAAMTLPLAPGDGQWQGRGWTHTDAADPGSTSPPPAGPLQHPASAEAILPAPSGGCQTSLYLPVAKMKHIE